MVTAVKTRTAAPGVTMHRGDGGRTMAQAAEAVTAKKMTAADVKAFYEAKLKSALDQAKVQGPPSAQVAEPYPWWDIIAIGPIQSITYPPFPPSDVIRSGELAWVATILILNPFYYVAPGMTACDVLSNFALPYEITYQTGNLTKWTQAPSPLTTEHDDLYLVPGQCYYVDVLEFTPNERDEVMFEMNISARIFGCNENYAAPFAGFAREVIDIDPGLWWPPPGLVSAPIRFLVYGNVSEELP